MEKEIIIHDENRTILRSKKLTSKIETRGGRQYAPYAFTEQGVYMLMTVLKGEHWEIVPRENI